MRVLLVSGDAGALGPVKRFLEDRTPDTRVVTVQSPEEALRLLSSEPFDCLVSDYTMPETDGIDLARRIRETSDIPIILYTDSAGKVVEEAFEAGVDSIALRTADPRHLLVLAKRVRLVVERRRSEDLYHGIVERVRDPMRIIAGTTVVHANQAMAELLGVDGPDDLMGHESTEWVVEEDRERVRETALGRQRGEAMPQFYEFTIQRRDGERRRVEASASLISYMGRPASLSFLRDITERKRLEEEVKLERDKALGYIKEIEETKGKLEALHYSALNYHRADTPEDIAEQTLDTVNKILGFDHASFSVVDGDIRRVIAVRGTEAQLPLELPLKEEGVTVRAFTTGETQAVPDTRLDPDYLGFPDKERFLSELAVPVKIDGDVVAVINVESERPDAFTGMDRMLVETLAAHAAAAFSRMQRTQERMEYQRKLRALHTNALQLRRAASLQTVYGVTLESMESTLGLARASVLMVMGDVLRQVAQSSQLPAEVVLPLDGGGVTVRCVRLGETILVPDVRKCEDYVYARDLPSSVEPEKGSEDSLSELAVPITADDKPVGVLNVESTHLDAFDEHDVRLLELLASYTGLAVSRLRNLDELRQSEARYRGLVENSPNAISVTVGDTIVYANRKRAELAGKDDPSELIGTSALSQIMEGDRESIAARREARKRGEKPPMQHMYRMLRADGSVRDMVGYSSEISYQGENAVQHVLHDVTEEKRYEERLEALHRHAAELQLAENVQQVCQLTLDALEQTLGFEYDTFLLVEEGALKTIGSKGAPTPDMSLPLDGKGITVKAANTGQTVLVNDLRGDPDYVRGSTYSLSELAVPVIIDGGAVAVLNVESLALGAFTGGDGRLLETLAHHVALALSRLRGVMRLRESEERFRGIAERSFDAIVTVGVERQFTFASPTVERITGYKPEELMGRSFQDLLPESEFPKTMEAFKDMQVGAYTEGLELEIRRKDETPGFIEVNGAPIIVEGRVVGAQGCFRDITDRKEMERRLRELAYRLNGLQPGGSFLSESHERVFKAYSDLTHHGVPGLCIIREDPGKMVEEYDLSSEWVRLLSSRPVKGFQTLEDLQTVSRAVSGFLEEHGSGVVLLDGLEYLVSRHGFDAVYGFVQEKRFDFLENGALLLVPLDPVTFSERERALLGSEIKTLR